MSIPPAWSPVLDFFGTPLVIEPSHGQLSSDAALLPIRQFDQRIGLTEGFADALDDPRDPDLTEHTFREMVRSRVYGILAGYEDQNDHDTLRTDPIFKLVADRSPEDDDLASQPTLSRFENAISIPSLKRLRDVSIPDHSKTRSRSQSPTTQNQVECSAEAEALIDHEAAAQVRAGAAQVPQDVWVGAAGLFQRVGKYGHVREIATIVHPSDHRDGPRKLHKLQSIDPSVPKDASGKFRAGVWRAHLSGSRGFP